MKNREKITSIVALVVSVLLHLGLIFAIPMKFAEHNKKDELNNPKNIETFLAFLPKEFEKEKMPIVDLMDDPHVKSKKSKDAQYLSDKDRSVAKETKAKNPTSKPTENSLIQSKPKSEKKETLLEDNGVYFSEEPPKNPGTKDGDDDIDLYPDVYRQGVDNRPYDPNYLEGLEEGERTQLNTREFLYSGYFTRIKRQISSHWDPQKAFQDIVKKSKSPRSDLKTELTITIDRKGSLRGLDIAKSSGQAEWDEESLRATRSAQPFRNPPLAMFGKNEFYTFNFGFIGSFDVNFFYKRIERMY